MDIAKLVIIPDRFPQRAGPLPDEITQKLHHLRPRRLRRGSAARNAASSGQHSFPGVKLPGAGLSSEEPPSHRSWHFPPVNHGFCRSSEIPKKSASSILYILLGVDNNSTSVFSDVNFLHRVMILWSSTIFTDKPVTTSVRARFFSELVEMFEPRYNIRKE